jgi:hypothetical protein
MKPGKPDNGPAITQFSPSILPVKQPAIPRPRVPQTPEYFALPPVYLYRRKIFRTFAQRSNGKIRGKARNSAPCGAIEPSSASSPYPRLRFAKNAFRSPLPPPSRGFEAQNPGSKKTELAPSPLSNSPQLWLLNENSHPLSPCSPFLRFRFAKIAVSSPFPRQTLASKRNHPSMTRHDVSNVPTSMGLPLAANVPTRYTSIKNGNPPRSFESLSGNRCSKKRAKKKDSGPSRVPSFPSVRRAPALYHIFANVRLKSSFRRLRMGVSKWMPRKADR